MPTFKDNQGREWPVEINVAAVKRVRRLLDVDLLQIYEGKLLDQLATDPILLVDVLYVLCKPEADARSVSDEDFGRAMAGDAIDAASRAFQESIVLFHRSPKVRANLGRVVEAQERALDQVADQVSQRLDEDLEGIVQGAVAAAMESAPPLSGGSSTSAPASSA